MYEAPEQRCRRNSMMCPGPEQAAAYADGRLDAADSARYLEHCSDCEECQRTPPPQLVAAPAPELALQEPAPKAPVAEAPRNPAPPRLPEEPRFALPVEPPVRVAPKPDDIRPEEPAARPPAHTVVARALTELQITDITGTLMVHRKGAKSKEKLSGVAHLADGDVP